MNQIRPGVCVGLQADSVPAEPSANGNVRGLTGWNPLWLPAGLYLWRLL